MSNQLRSNAAVNAITRPSRHVDWPTTKGRLSYVSEIFGEKVFTLSKMAESLPKPEFKKFVEQVQGRQQLDRSTADAVAHAVRIWAMNKGATHYCHWFQPQTGTTASKHDTFLSLKTVNNNGVDETIALDAFSGGALMQSEPDASSFPNGGMRTTFEARGYTVWDTASPMFLRPAAHGTFVLYIPSVFISYNGEALDEKTILLRSNEAVSNAAVKLLHVLGKTHVKRVITTLGCEQEFFLIDRSLYQMRPDLKMTGRSLVGSVPPKHQQLEDHYFGAIPSRVVAVLGEVEMELFKLGVPLKTRHNEVAPNQFEVAPIFEEAAVAVDHNLLTMEVFHTVSHRHGLKVLFHEKPFKGVNGSGKHANWALSTDTGENLLDPSATPETNYQFLLVLAATLDAVHKHGGLLRAGIASASNEHRLGAQEAPPGIVSAFMGEHLDEVLNAVEEGRPVNSKNTAHLTSVKVGGTQLDIKVSTLPDISRDLTDRNRTSPFAFTGNKFEFRAVGSKQSPSFPVTLLNSAVAASLNDVAAALIEQKGEAELPTTDDILAVVRKFIAQSKNIRFEGNNYSQEWVEEAARRGLPNIKSAPAAFKQLLVPANVDVLVSQGVLSQNELNSRYHILNETYTKNQLIEANTLSAMVSQSILPAAFTYRKELCDSLRGLKEFVLDYKSTPEFTALEALHGLTNTLQSSNSALLKVIHTVENLGDTDKEAEVCGSELVAALNTVRNAADALEGVVADKHWPFPKYAELLF
ncbi:hypothetical protein HK099_008318 [Clydaea vesicula]|uniref:Glutamine synthetase n=1 Tax=Clydaea vesicula TaxID=447962 RepID=A0AAD5U7U4_9FUNG|nr:hypothetical protein HK099_008318 [Clydaea vesicula]KAJ3379064.1 hypothetical protein HDU92_006925 [Lobulomyces angularis]